MKNLKFFALLAIMFAGSPMSAQSEEAVYIFLQAEIAEYLGFSTLKNEALHGLGVGYRFDGPVAVELDFLTGDSQTQHGNTPYGLCQRNNRSCPISLPGNRQG